MHWLTEPSTNVKEEYRISVAACQDLQKIPGVRNCGSHIGQALLSDEVYGVYFGENWISIDKDVDYDKTLGGGRAHRRRLSGHAARRADLPARARQGGPD